MDSDDEGSDQKGFTMADFIIIAVLAIIVFLILRKSVGRLRKGQCPGGCGSCGNCGGCGADRDREKAC